jgi:hypothetical protein
MQLQYLIKKIRYEIVVARLGSHLIGMGRNILLLLMLHLTSVHQTLFI